jgi:predicted small lipoprotein YifL
VKKVLALVVIFALCACGKRGDPKPPVPIIPQATTDLVVTQRADKVLLTWSYPSLTTAGKSLTDIRRITVLRYVEDLPVTPAGQEPNIESEPQPIAQFAKVPTIAAVQFAKLATKVDSIEKANLASATAGARLLFTDSPPLRSSDGRPVRINYAVVTEGAIARSAPSNLAIIVPLPVGLPPADVKATADEKGVTVTWKEPTQSIGNQGAPVIGGYFIYRTPLNTAPTELTPPLNSAPSKGNIYVDTPPYGDHEYRVAAVAMTGPPLLQGELSEPAKVRFKDFAPPPAPASITPLIEENGVRLIWDAVEAPDLAGYRLYRTEATGHDANRREVGTVNVFAGEIKETQYTDHPALGIAFKYAVVAVDKSNNESARVWTDWIVIPKTP